jgi:hypothetical protein
VTGQELLRRGVPARFFFAGEGEVAAARKNGKFFRPSRIAGSSNFEWTLFSGRETIVIILVLY